MCDQDCTCVNCTVTFGRQLVSLFHIWIDITSKADEHLDQVVYDIEACTSALSQLNVFVEQGKASTTQIFTPAGHQEIEALGIKCNLIFKAVILLVQKAAERKNSDSDDSDDSDDADKKVQNWVGGSTKSTKKQERGDGKVEENGKVEEKSELLVGPVPSLTSPKTLGLVGRLSGRWDWLSNRITRCQIQLRWVRKSLLLHVQMGRLTCLANNGSTNVNGTFESQTVVRASVLLLRHSQLVYVRHKARKQQCAEKKAQRRLEAQKEADTESIHSSSSRVTTSTVVAEQPPMVKSPDERLAAPAPLCPPALNINGIPSCIQPPGQAESQASTKPKASEERKEKGSSKLSTSINELSLKLSDTMSDWTQRIFGKDDEFSKDWESQELEAWVFRTHNSYTAPIKVPFGHQRLQYGLKKIKTKKSNNLSLTTFARYIDGGPRVQVLVDEVVREANRLQKRERVCVAFEEFRRQDNGGEPFTLVFFSIRQEKAPISFRDCIGRKMTLPFETCRTWEGMNVHIVEAFRHIPGIGPHVLEGHFSLEDFEKKEHILPGLWSNTIRPGASINMLMWPNLNVNHPLRGFYRSPPYGPPPRQEAEAVAQRERISRMQTMFANRPPHLRGYPMAAGIRPPMSRPMGHPGGPMPANFPPFGARPGPPGVSVLPQNVVPLVSRVCTIDEDELTEAEEKELTFVNFVEELNLTKNMTATDILAKYTQLHDVLGQECMDEWNVDDSRSGSDSDSSGSSSTGSYSIVD